MYEAQRGRWLIPRYTISILELRFVKYQQKLVTVKNEGKKGDLQNTPNGGFPGR